ncbi:probable NADH dehydrogenase [ubiquinone] 1 alpha subcomplex subunit 5 [Ruditapes philippinarum]|uniref:probable NADH dehydrogenase [ubiquinone] 1 alpha subcomplex subunit 5 n=1 Tax=Ruditapes philippinarum TaxID=129788 RepID=UPI00295B560D|nr:probable NADH dehydrogenase [ubiquinone] 1 alpha subcomplex subunit 5 [Ruditapes philippinarum]
MSGAARRVTGLTGLKVVEEPHKKLVNLYERTLRVLGKMPADASYRVNTQAIIKQRLQLVQSESDIATLERKINNGRIEEIIRQAERELHLARNFVQYKPWEPLIAEAPKGQFQWPPC